MHELEVVAGSSATQEVEVGRLLKSKQKQHWTTQWDPHLRTKQNKTGQKPKWMEDLNPNRENHRSQIKAEAAFMSADLLIS